MKSQPKHKGGRYGVDNPKHNIITFKCDDLEKDILDLLAEELFGNRSETIRTLVFDIALAIDPMIVKENLDEESIKRLENKLEKYRFINEE